MYEMRQPAHNSFIHLPCFATPSGTSVLSSKVAMFTKVHQPCISLRCHQYLLETVCFTHPAAHTERAEKQNECEVFSTARIKWRNTSRRETHGDVWLWHFSVSFLAPVCFLWESHWLQLVILHPLRDGGVMCAMLLCLISSKEALVTAVMETITNPRLSSEFSSWALTTCLRESSLFISVANRSNDQDKYSLIHWSWLKQTSTV